VAVAASTVTAAVVGVDVGTERGGNAVAVAVGSILVGVASGLGSTPVNMSAAITPRTAKMTNITPHPTKSQVNPPPAPSSPA
jgi:hypothetical protein